MKVVITLLLTALWTVATAQPRETLWLRGINVTSHGWEQTQARLRGQLPADTKYDFVDLVSDNAIGGGPAVPYLPELGIEGAAQTLTEYAIGNATDVLGFGHDSGGITLRQLAAGANSGGLSAMILVGTPNQGSALYRNGSFTVGQNVPSELELLVQRAKSISSSFDCEDCELMDKYEAWVTDIRETANLYTELGDNSNLISELNAQSPSIPHAILYGTTENFSIASLIDSRTSSVSFNSYEDCYATQLAEAREELGENKAILALNRNGGFLNRILSFMGDLSVTNPNPFIAIRNFIESQKNQIISNIREIDNINDEQERIMRCELANQWLAVEWELKLSESSLTVAEVDVTTNPNLQSCLLDCANDIAFGEVSSDTDCSVECAEFQGQQTTSTIEAFVAEENDGILTKSEQQLDGAAGTYHLANTNHFEENLINSAPDLRPALEDLFAGNAGAAFVVPEQ